ncbi:MAG TPA: ABC transporter substrate-binding protein [Planctomycetota bacterium]|nr:ABC transporter substrate-binding protein [Planctomycetota bacterium]
MKPFRTVAALLLTASLLPAQQETRGGVKAGTDTLMLYYANDPNTINPIIGNDTVSEDFQRWVVDALAERRFANPDEWEALLAEKWEFDEKNLEYTIHIRKGVKWHPSKFPDGTPIPARELTADDVKFSFDVIVNRHVDAASLRSYYEDPDAKEEAEKIKIRVSQVDKYTLKVKWTKPYFQADEFTLGIPVVPKHVYGVDAKGEPLSLDVSSEEFAKGFNDHWANSILVGTGPMMFSKWTKNDRLELVRAPDYWGKPFYFSKAVFRNIPNANTSLEMMLNNELDWASIPDKSLYVQTKEKAQVKEGKVKLAEYDYPGYRYIGWNQKREIFKEKAVRTALAHAIPVQKIIDKVLYGLGKPLSGPFLPGSSAYDPSLAPIPFDADKAKKLLEGAGWKDTNNNGVRDKSILGKLFELKFDFMIYADSAMYKVIAEIVKEEFRQIGVDVQISPVKWALMLEKLHKKEFDACMLGWAMSWKQDLFQIWHSSQAEAPESSNAIGYKSPELDKLIDQQRVTFDPAKQKELYHKMHRILYEDQPYAFLFVDKQTGGYVSRIQNVNYYKIRPCKDHREWFAPPGLARK